MSFGSGCTPAGTAPSRAAKMGGYPAGTPAPAHIPFPSEPTMDGACGGSAAPRPTLGGAGGRAHPASAAMSANTANSVEALSLSMINIPYRAEFQVKYSHPRIATTGHHAHAQEICPQYPRPGRGRLRSVVESGPGGGKADGNGLHPDPATREPPELRAGLLWAWRK